MDPGSDGHKQVPDGVGEGDAAITLEEDGAKAIENASSHELQEAICVGLKKQQQGMKRRKETRL